ncbi:MAG: NAD-binding protein [Candidatus Riflebacteria bacterium]
MKIIIAGSGKEFFFLSRKFIEKGYKVTLISRERKECLALYRKLKVEVIEGEVGNIEVLQQAGAANTDIFLAMTESDSDNMISAQIARIEFKVPKVVALANDPENISVFEKLSISAFSNSSIIVSLIEERIVAENVLNLQPVANGKVLVSELKIGEGFGGVGKPLKELQLPKNVLIGIIIRNEVAIVPGGDDVIFSGDSVVLLTLPDNHGKTIKTFSGDI